MVTDTRLAEERISDRIVETILDDLTDRGGLGDAWHSIDYAAQEGIKQLWRDMIEKELTR